MKLRESHASILVGRVLGYVLVIGWGLPGLYLMRRKATALKRRLPAFYLAGTRLPAIQADSSLRVLPISSRGLAESTTKSAHLPRSSVPI